MTNAPYATGQRKKIRVAHILAMKGNTPVVALTCYDATFARILENTGVHVVLVGDSLGHVVQGHSSTVGVRLEHMVYHTACVARALRTPLLVADMPFGSAGFSNKACFDAAVALMQAGAEAVKIEGANPKICQQIERLTAQGIPVMGHIGLMPQSVHGQSGYRVQGRNSDDANRLIREAQDLQRAGCFSLVLEMVDPGVSQEVQKAVTIPTIGIGAGPHVDGQILVLQDMLGLNLNFKPSFLRHFAKLETVVTEAVAAYAHAIDKGEFP